MDLKKVPLQSKENIISPASKTATPVKRQKTIGDDNAPAPGKLSLKMKFHGVVKTLSVFPPFKRDDLINGLESIFPYAKGKIGSIKVGEEIFLVTDQFVDLFMIPNVDKEFEVILKDGNTNGGTFNPKEVVERLQTLWQLKATFGVKTESMRIYVDEIVSDRYALSNGLQVIRDELQLAFSDDSDVSACGANLSLPTVITTLAHTNCGDRIQRQATPLYEKMIASRFATLSEQGDLKVEHFTPAGGGTDNGKVLAHVTVSHQMDGKIRKSLYNGNCYSFVLVNVDVMTHVGRLDTDTWCVWGRTKESPWREDRTACGAICATLTTYDPDNVVHKRLRSDLGEENFAYLTKTRVILPDGTDLTYVIAAAIVAIQGIFHTCRALCDEMDERGVAHVTACTTVNRMSMMDPLIYLGRATVFQREIKYQGFGTDSRKYGGRMQQIEGSGSGRFLVLTYEGRDGALLPIQSTLVPNDK